MMTSNMSGKKRKKDTTKTIMSKASDPNYFITYSSFPHVIGTPSTGASRSSLPSASAIRSLVEKKQKQQKNLGSDDDDDDDYTWEEEEEEQRMELRKVCSWCAGNGHDTMTRVRNVVAKEKSFLEILVSFIVIPQLSIPLVVFDRSDSNRTNV